MTTMSWRRLGVSESDREEVPRRWITGEDMETFPEDTFEKAKDRIVGGGERERQVMQVGGGERLGWWRPHNSCFWTRGGG